MRLPPTRPARFLARPNRFVVEADLGGEPTRCFCANPGRLAELLRPGAALRVAATARGSAHRTAHDALMVRHGRAWVGLDTRWASPLFREAAEAGLIEGTAGPLEAEVSVADSRLDFRGGGGELIEVKSASLVRDGLALFPDAPSERAARHARMLAQAARRGTPATLAFVIVHPGARALAPNDATDPSFGRALRAAARAGVRVRAFACHVGPREAEVAEELHVVGLDPGTRPA